MLRFALLFFVLATTTLACANISANAKSQFGSHFSCPDPRVEVVPRPTMQWGEIRDRLLPKTVEAPSAEIVADPERLAKWKEDRELLRAEQLESYNRYEVYELNGCGHTVLMGCDYLRIGNKIYVNNVVCDDPIEVQRVP